FVGSDDTPWFCRINDALSRTQLTELEWEGRQYDLSSRRARAAANALLQSSMKSHPHRDVLERTASLVLALGDRPERRTAPESEYRMLAPEEIRAMAGTGLIDFGAHTRTHAILSGLSTSERAAEILGSLAAVERFTGVPCELFAYPNGRPSDYGPCDVAALEASGIAVAVTTIAGPNKRTVPPLEMRRYGIGADTTLARFKLLTHHV